jgi:hypothetical protein
LKNAKREVVQEKKICKLSKKKKNKRSRRRKKHSRVGLNSVASKNSTKMKMQREPGNKMIKLQK